MTRLSAPTFPSFGKRLKRQRAALGLKQEALAVALGVSQTTVSRWESGAQVPEHEMQQRALRELGASRADDAAIKRLIEGADFAVHLVDEASHECLAYSKTRARDWNVSMRSLIGVSLWQFATEEIQQAEAELDGKGWWDDIAPAPQRLITSGAIYPELRISAGGMIWERMYLADGRPVRLTTGF